MKLCCPLLFEHILPATASQVCKQVDADVEEFHRRPLRDRNLALMFDGVVLARKTGAGVIWRSVLAALGLSPDGRKVVIDYGLAAGEP